MPKKKFSLSHRFFPSKLLLFGEHTVNKGSAGLAVPTGLFEGFLKISPALSGHQSKSNASLELLANYIVFHPKLSQHMDTNRLLTDIEDGLYFDSNIPEGYGLGSSGALAAALLHNYGIKIDTSNFSAVKEILADIESYYHGKSSGLDALVSYLNQPVYITQNTTEAIRLPAFSNISLKFFLLDTGKKRQTSTYVNLFLQKTEKREFESKVQKFLVPNVNLCIEAFRKNEPQKMFKAFGLLSHHQMDLLPEFIPQSVYDVWREGLKSGAFYLKICGAGGGGFMLGICQPEVTPDVFFPNHKVLILP
jgi:mevalonate kinase